MADTNEWFNTTEGEKPHASLWNYNNQDFIGGGGCHYDSDMNVTSGATIPAGVLLEVDFETRKAYVVKNAKILGGTASSPQVSKGSLFKVQDAVYVSGAAVTITAIDTSNSSYDVFSLSGSVEGFQVGKFFENAVAAGESPVMAHTPNAITQEWQYNVNAGSPVMAAVLRIYQDVDTSVFPIPISPAQIALANETGRFLLY